MTSHRIVVATGEVVGPKMAGPAIRAVRMAQALAGEHQVELVSFRGAAPVDERFPCSYADGATLDRLARGADVAVIQGDVLRGWPALHDSKAAIVVDLYDPFHLEVLQHSRALSPSDRQAAVTAALDVLNQQLRRGDFFLCATARQRDLWLGHLAGLGRVNHCTADASPDLRALLAVVPFGVDDAPPTRTAAGVRGSVHGIGVDDDVIVWGGGIYEWFDPLTLVHAIDRLRRRRPTVRLVFAGARHPNPTVGETSMGARTRALADDLGLTGTHVFFSDWAEHGARQNLLLDADIGVSTHVRGIETDYSFRTRVLDYLWASLPVVTTAGDALADEVVAGGAGIAIPPSDVEALEAALAQILDDDVLAHSLRSGAASLAPAYHWSRVLAPLLEFCRAPARAPDLLDAGMAQAIRRGAELSHSGVRSSAARAAALARGGDWAELRRRLVDRARRRG